MSNKILIETLDKVTITARPLNVRPYLDNGPQEQAISLRLIEDGSVRGAYLSFEQVEALANGLLALIAETQNTGE